MVGFYKHDIPAWMDGTEALSDGAYRVYHVVIQLIRLNEGPIVRNDRGIAGRANQTIRTFTRHLDELLTAGKLVLVGDKIGNGRATKELESIRQNRVNVGEGGKTSGNRHVNSADLDVAPANPLQNNDADEAALNNLRSLREKKRLPQSPHRGRAGRLRRVPASLPEAQHGVPDDTSPEALAGGPTARGDAGSDHSRC